MKKMLLSLFLIVPITGIAQNEDFVRAEAYKKYDKDTREAMEVQSALLADLIYHHKWVEEHETHIGDLKKEYDDYLKSFREAIAVAAQMYGMYYEYTEIIKNLSGIEDAISIHPTNLLANAFSSQKTEILTRVYGSTTDLLFDLKMTFVNKERLSERERIKTLDNIRKKMKKISRELRQIERNIRYYNMCDLWNEIKGKTFGKDFKTRKEIAIEARDAWRSHYSIDPETPL